MITRLLHTARTRWNRPGGYGEALAIGLPLVASMASSTVMQFTDRLFLSHYSVQAISAALPATLTSLLFMLTFMGISGYAGVFIAQYVGAGRPHRVGAALWQSLWCSLVFGLVLGGISFFADALFDLAGHALELRELEVCYFTILSWGGGLVLLGNSLGCFFSGRGQTRPVMVANVVGAVINVPLDYALINGHWGLPEMGIAGAGIATVIGGGITFVLLACLTFRREHERCYRVLSAWRIEWALMVRMLRYGVPSGVNYFMELFAVTWFVFQVGTLGETALAATNIAFSINTVAFLPTIGLNIAAATMVGHAMGSGKPDDAASAAWSCLHIAMAWMLMLALLFFFVPGPLIELFRTSGEGDAYGPIRDQTVLLLRFVMFYCLFDSFTVVFSGALKGAGDTAFVMWNMTLGCLLGLLLPAYVAKHLGWWSLETLWIIFTGYVVLLAAASAIRFHRGRWRTMRLLERKPVVPE